MKIFLSYILLFLYTLTCTGSSVYMHMCDKGSIFIVQSEQENADAACPLCDKASSHTEKTSAKEHSCGTQDDCCNDVKVDLKKADNSIENAPATLAFLSLSPAIVTLHWIVLFPQEITSAPQATETSAVPLFATASPPYLIHCNFRI
ncbi:hypothetical protein PQ465_17575 [Sphingobacterium oryzagri]|uniref:Uncharacterized protein n=1 Tax=Sphingobacterium oryzagri TaxID=3025669 RepID=A0ABY7WHK9_9SPHI|nr:hypothetical protein [Sphingobacterium sp. KACC 22765]WDF68094.1 hypothetical protein PQ465_17575 [Sphingobacterium sp. KACC 22765]